MPVQGSGFYELLDLVGVSDAGDSGRGRPAGESCQEQGVCSASTTFAGSVDYSCRFTLFLTALLLLVFLPGPSDCS